MPKISVIIPCYNQGQYINDAVDSILEQTFQDVEIIIVNDGSSDDYTNKLLETYNKPNIKVITTKNRGVSSARNTAVKNSSGNYILPLDADDKIEETYLEKALNILVNNDNIKIVYCDIKLFGTKKGIKFLPDFNSNLFYTQNIIHVSGLFRKDDFEKVGGYDEKMRDGLEDWEFWISLLKTGGFAFKINEPLLLYRQHEGSRQLSLDRNNIKKVKIRSYIENKHLNFYVKKYGSVLTLATENQKLLQKNKLLENSKAFKIGTFILWPIKVILKKRKLWI